MLPRRALTGLFLAALVLCTAPQTRAQAASELDSLKSAVSNMERTILELKEKIRQLEQRQVAAPVPNPVPAPIPAPGPSASDTNTLSNVPVPEKTGTPTSNRQAQTEGLADHPSLMRHRETITGDHITAPRPGNAPVDPTYAGFMPLFSTKTWIRLGGYAKLDAIMDSTKLGNPTKFVTGTIPVEGDPTYDSDEEFTLHAKQTRLNLELRAPSPIGSIRIFYENDFYGGGSATDMQYNLRHFYGQMANVTLGQTWTAFVDPDAIPDTLDFAGPGMQSIVRQPQLRYTFSLPPEGMHLALSMEQPKSDLVALPAGASSRNAMPDFASHWRMEGTRGHLQLAGLVRSLGYDNPNGVEDEALGWGVNLSGAVHTWGKDSVVARLSYGDGIGRYMQDLATGNGAVVDSNGEVRALEAWGAMLGYRHFWSERWRSEFTYSYLELNNRIEQGSSAYDHTHYGQGNLIWAITPHFNAGIEYLYGTKQERDGDKGDDHRILLSLQYKLIR